MDNTYDANQPQDNNPLNATQDLGPGNPNATYDGNATFDKSKQDGTFDKSKQDGTFDKSKQDGTFDKSKQDGTFDKSKSKMDGTFDKSKSKMDGTFDKSKKDGTFDANLSTAGSPRPGGYLTLGTQSPKGATAMNVTGPAGCKSPEKGSQTGDIHECTCLSEKCKELAKEARLAAEAEVKEQPPQTMKSFNYNEKKRAREAQMKMVNLFAAMDGTPPPDNWDVVEDEEEADRSRMRPFNPHPQTNLIVATMSAVMLLAKGQQCKYKYMEAADTYLSTIKDEDGNAPPNVQGFLNLLHYKLIEAREKGWDKLDDNTYSTINDTSDFNDTTPPPPPPPEEAAAPKTDTASITSSKRKSNGSKRSIKSKSSK